MDVHYIHHRSLVANAIPVCLCLCHHSLDCLRFPDFVLFKIILIHGWPGSFHEFLYVAPLLIQPPQGEQAFHIVIPSQPGFTFSSPPKKLWTMDDTARIYDKLMVGLGYHEYASQGGDWGSVTARCLGALYPQRCKGKIFGFNLGRCDKIYTLTLRILSSRTS